VALGAEVARPAMCRQRWRGQSRPGGLRGPRHALGDQLVWRVGDISCRTCGRAAPLPIRLCYGGQVLPCKQHMYLSLSTLVATPRVAHSRSVGASLKHGKVSPGTHARQSPEPGSAVANTRRPACKAWMSASAVRTRSSVSWMRVVMLASVPQAVSDPQHSSSVTPACISLLACVALSDMRLHGQCKSLRS